MVIEMIKTFGTNLFVEHKNKVTGNENCCGCVLIEITSNSCDCICNECGAELGTGSRE